MSTPAASTTQPKSSSERMLALDVLRCVAILLVIVHHAGLHWLPDTLGANFVRFLGAGGWVGVDLFFVLSGFLVSGLLFREYQRDESIRFRRFLMRRGLKIYPAFYVFLVATYLRFYVDGRALMGPEIALRRLKTVLGTQGISEALFVQNYFDRTWIHTWSLAVEEHFYLLLPLLFFFLLKRRTEGPFGVIPRICLTVSIVVLGLRLVTNHLHPNFSPEVHFFPTHLRIDALMFGVFLSYVYHYEYDRFVAFARRWFWPLVLVGTGLMTVAGFLKLPDSVFLRTFGFTQIYIGSGMVLSAFVARGIPANLLTRTLGYVGQHSYSIYLWHALWLFFGLPRIERNLPQELDPAVRFACYALGSIVLGILMARLVETPVLKLRDRFVPSGVRTMRS